MGLCATKETEGNLLNYAEINASTKIVKDKTNTQQNATTLRPSSHPPTTQRPRRPSRNYRFALTKLYLAQMQQLLYATHGNNLFYRVPSQVSSLVLRYLPTYFKVYGIGKNIISTNVISEYERLGVFEPKITSVDNLYRGHNKFFIKTYASEIYGVGSNSFDGLCLNCDDFQDNDYIFKHITSFYNYFNFVDQEQSIEFLSDSIFSNDIFIKLRNGSIYQSSLTMDEVGDWKRVFVKPQFDDLSMKKHQNIIEIKCGLLHALFLFENGAVCAQGGNANGQCGLGIISPNVDKIQSITRFISEEIRIQSISCGQHHSSVVDENGSLWCFGYNKFNQCGLLGANIANKISQPMRVLTDIDIIAKSECGESFTVFLTNKGVYGGFGKMIVSTLERANITEWDTKDMIFKDISCGLNHVLLIGEDNKVYAHGSNEYYKCGLKTGRAGKPTMVKYDTLPSDLQPSAAIAGMDNSLIIFSSTVD